MTAAVEIRRLDTGEVRYHSYRKGDTRKTLLESIAENKYGRMHFCDLRNSDLKGAQLKGGILDYANFAGSDLTGADLTCCDLRGCDFMDVNMKNTTLIGADVRTIRFRPLPGTWDPLDSLMVPPIPGYARHIAETYLEQKGKRTSLGALAITLSGTGGLALWQLTSISMAGAILLPEAAHLFEAGEEAETEWCQKILKSRKGGKLKP